MPITVRKAVSQRDFHRLYRFRYEVYVEEMQRPQHHANHDERTIIEPLDDTAHLFIAEDEQGRVVGTGRINFGGESDFGIYRQLYGLECLGDYPLPRVSITSKFMVAPSLRCSFLGLRLALEIYRFGLKEGIQIDFIDCNPHLESLFEGLGYRRYRSRIHHPEYGDVLPLVLLLSDLQHLESVRSPFARACRQLCPHHTAQQLLQPAIQAHHPSPTQTRAA
ncbi:MAG: GNAT family N-acetyltransferase [Verrucomicrobiaceae bacterium]|nr:GNAT family N-acetyltransferase [Verrucomicrobiaceae bacterium]